MHISANIFVYSEQATKALRQKDTPNNADNVQRLLICGTRYKNDLRMEEGRSQELREQIEELEGRLENAVRLSKLDSATIEELRGVIGKESSSRMWHKKY